MDGQHVHVQHVHALESSEFKNHFDLFMIMKLFVLFSEKENMEYENFSNDLDKINK